jgi:hypothetical protein
MAIQKKSLISNRETAKKAVVAKSTLDPQTVASKSGLHSSKSGLHSSKSGLHSSKSGLHSSKSGISMNKTMFKSTFQAN